MCQTIRKPLYFGKAQEKGIDFSPLFSLVYCRRAPRILVRHTLEAKLCPIMIMYDEAAFDGLAALFDSDYVTDDDTELSPNGLLQQLPVKFLFSFMF